MSRPTSIRIFLADGVPDGVRVVSKSNWTGQAVVASRTQLADALRRDELDRPGVYVLTGVDDAGNSRIYVGEADALGKRLKQHEAKDFWTRFIAFSASDQTINKAHVRYLESRLLALAKAANQWRLENSVAPSAPPMAEADRADADWFLDEMLVILPILGVDAFESAAGDTGPTGEQTYVLDGRGGLGKGREAGEDFIVRAGSRARIDENASIHAYVTSLRQELLSRAVMEMDGDVYVFRQDYRFSSPSTAAAVLVAGNANGRVMWKTPEGRTLKEVQQERAESSLEQ